MIGCYGQTMGVNRMNGNIVAVNRSLGVIVVETSTRQCVVLSARGLSSLTIGAQVTGDWGAEGNMTVTCVASGAEHPAEILSADSTRSEAVGSMALI